MPRYTEQQQQAARETGAELPHFTNEWLNEFAQVLLKSPDEVKATYLKWGTDKREEYKAFNAEVNKLVKEKSKTRPEAIAIIIGQEAIRLQSPALLLQYSNSQQAAACAIASDIRPNLRRPSPASAK